MRLPLASVLSLSLFIFISFFGTEAQAAEPYFKKGDVIALVGGEDMVVASENGYLEYYLTRGLPDYHLRFRNLAWEGDTVFEQRRELNFPSWEEQLDKTGATVVMVQFGQMESLAGPSKAPDFIAAYEALLQRFSGGGKRRIVVFFPNRFEPSVAYSEGAVAERNAVLDAYCAKIEELKKGPVAPLVVKAEKLFLPQSWRSTRDGIHLNPVGQQINAGANISALDPRVESNYRQLPEAQERLLISLIVAKNNLWFDYWRPQNWAFLAGDRTAQPSSRDHLDPSKRWFPPEREQFLPLIDAKEKEIDAFAAQPAKP